MAQIIQQTVVVQISKLVKDGHVGHLLINDQQIDNILQAIPTIVEELLDDSSLIVEAQLQG